MLKSLDFNIVQWFHKYKTNTEWLLIDQTLYRLFRIKRAMNYDDKIIHVENNCEQCVNIDSNRTMDSMIITNIFFLYQWIRKWRRIKWITKKIRNKYANKMTKWKPFHLHNYQKLFSFKQFTSSIYCVQVYSVRLCSTPTQFSSAQNLSNFQQLWSSLPFHIVAKVLFRATWIISSLDSFNFIGDILNTR